MIMYYNLKVFLFLILLKPYPDNNKLNEKMPFGVVIKSIVTPHVHLSISVKCEASFVVVPYFMAFRNHILHVFYVIY